MNMKHLILLQLLRLDWYIEVNLVIQSIESIEMWQWHKELKICQTFLFPEQSVMTQSRDKTVKQSSIVCLSSSILKSGITLDCIATQWLTFF